MLFLYYHSIRSDAFTVKDHIKGILKGVKHDIVPYNIDSGFSQSIFKSNVEVVILHYTCFGSLSREFFNIIQASNALKIAFFQDEYTRCEERWDYINRLDIECVFSLYSQEVGNEFYLENCNAKTVIPTLAGYVTEKLQSKALHYKKVWYDRKIDVSYRARELPFYFGAGAREKYEIGRSFKKHFLNYQLELDLEENEDKRKYGDSWFSFLGESKFTLGVEGGVSIVDLTGSVERETKIALERDPHASFQSKSENVLEKYEDNLYYRMISPRIFEAAAFECVMILYRGSYSGILKPDVHYIPLDKDHSNHQEVYKKMQDDKYTASLRRNAKADLIDSGEYSYQGLCDQIDNYVRLHGKPVKADLRLQFYIYIVSFMRLPIRWLRSIDFPGRKYFKTLYHKVHKINKI